MTDHPTDRAIVDGIVRIWVEERRLEDPCWENHLVVQRVVVGVHNMCTHAPLVFVHRLAELRQIISGEVLGKGLAVGEVALAAQIQIANVLPLIRVPYFIGKGVQFCQGLLLGRIAHPRQTVDAVAEGSTQIFHHSFHLGFAFFWEIAVGV